MANKKHISIYETIEKYLSQKYEFRYNVVTDKLEGRIKNTEDWKSVVDYALNTMLTNINKAGVDCKTHHLRTILKSNFVQKYNPFTDYLFNLPEWDQETNHIQELAATVKTTNDSIWQLCFKKWIVALVGSLIHDHVINQTVIVFSGEQGLGKTTWILNLVPSHLKQYCYSGIVNPNNKDTLIHLSECMLINLDELENLNRSELGSMKEMITKENIRMRRPYGHSQESLVRRASFAGSVNGKEFLSDTTGNRRFLCFEAIAINYQHAISIDDVFAQAFHLYKNGFEFWFNRSEIAMVNHNNEQFRITSIEEEMLLTYFEPCNVDEADYTMTTTELLSWLAERAKILVTESSKKKLGMALRLHKFERMTKQSRYVYILKSKDAIEATYLNKIGLGTRIPDINIEDIIM